MARIDVQTASHTYAVYLGSTAVPELLEQMAGYTKIYLVTQRGWPRRYAEHVSDRLHEAGVDDVGMYVAPSGERAKSWQQVRSITEAMAHAGLDRRSLVLGIGGGVVTDLAGFCAAVYMRGIDVMHVSTTLLGQVDAAIGGKTGINMNAGKNLVGAFWQPRAVAADTTMLRTLSKRQRLAGLAEVVKYGWIMDPELLRLCGDTTTRWDQPDRLETLVARCITHKARVVAADEREGGMRAILNFGHTLAHALEALGAYKRMLHGEAVAVGMHVAVQVGRLLDITPASCLTEMDMLHQWLGLPLSWPEWADPEEAIQVARGDKKNTGQAIKMVLLSGAGNAQLPMAVDEPTILSAIRRLQPREGCDT